jgi:hypothetical protein
VLGQGAASAAQPPQTPQAQAPPPTCSAPEHQQFDFWAGEWDVTAPNGQRAGGNRIERTLKGCALMEHWTSASGNEGTSINYYDRLTKQWYQSWMSDGGGALRMKGGLVDGSMVMETDPVTRPDGTVPDDAHSTNQIGNHAITKRIEFINYVRLEDVVLVVRVTTHVVEFRFDTPVTRDANPNGGAGYQVWIGLVISAEV